MSHLSSLTHEDLGSTAQRDRHTRILEATISLASKGGFDAVQMRAVADHADVALGTLYRYFPSKIHLLVSALARQFEHAAATTERRPTPGETAADRVMFVLGRTTRAMQRDPNLTEALTRSFVFADASVANEINEVGKHVTRMLVRAMHGARVVEDDHEPTEDEIAIARVIGDVWLASLVSWVTGRASTVEVSKSMDVAVRLLLR